MSKFRVGDIVVGNEKADEKYSVTTRGYRATVVSVDGERMTIRQETASQWVERTGMPKYRLVSRIRMGWPVERALTEPVHESHVRKRAA